MKKIIYLILLLPVITQAQIITTFAGDGIQGFLGDGGPAIGAELYGPAGTAVDSAGNLYIADYGNSRIRMVSYSTGIITTIAGTGDTAYGGDGGPATAAMLYFPTAVALDAFGNIFIADQSNNRIRKINASTGIITTVAGTGTGGYFGDSVAATASELYYPSNITFDAAGDLMIADWENNRIRKVTMSTGIITTIAGSGVAGYSGDGGPASAAKFNKPSGIAFDAAGDMYVSEWGNSTVRKITASTGIITTVAGTGIAGYSSDGGAATVAALYMPLGVATDTSGNIYISDWYHSNRVRIVYASTGIIGTVAGDGVQGYSGDGGPATTAELDGTDGVTIDLNGNLYISDEFNDVIREVTCPICLPASVPVFNHSQQLAIYPNPATSAITISSTNPISTLTIANLLGQSVFTNNYNADKIQVDVSALPTGMYLVKINGTAVQKFIKQ